MSDCDKTGCRKIAYVCEDCGRKTNSVDLAPIIAERDALKAELEASRKDAEALYEAWIAYKRYEGFGCIHGLEVRCKCGIDEKWLYKEAENLRESALSAHEALRGKHD